jgi:glycerol-1-phosphate dehydrogenase [NAD(P)+]
MELPRQILIGKGVMTRLGTFVRELKGNTKNICIISGNTVKSRIYEQCREALGNTCYKFRWYETPTTKLDQVLILQSIIAKDRPEIILGIGGGRSVDVAKIISYNLKTSYISVPTSASHDGISSPFVSIKSPEKPYSIKAHAPLGVLADTKLISEAPPRLQSSGCGDLIGKITAVKDWELARDEKDEYFGTYAASLAYMSAKIIMENSQNLGGNTESEVRTIVEALISAGVASCIAGSSRPCSGAEHLFSHALEYISNHECGLHGERVGIGTIIMSNLHGLDHEVIVKALENVNAPTTASQLNIKEDQMVKSLLIAQSLRLDRFTILGKLNLDKDSARGILKKVNVI